MRVAAIHEAGHAVARVRLKLGAPVRITLNGAGGRAFVETKDTVLDAVTEERAMGGPW